MKARKIALSLLAAGMGAALISGAHAATDAERIKALEDQIQAMAKELAAIKSESATKKDVEDVSNQLQATTKENVVLGDMPNSIRMPGNDTSLHIYGTAEIHAINDMNATAPAGDYFANPALQPLRGSAAASNTGNTYFAAQNSRLGFETSTPTAVGALHTVVEADFYDGGSSNGLLRLRHAYGEYNGWTVGQTWSTFVDGDNAPETVDFNGPPGWPGYRDVQVRYTYAVPDLATFKVAIENAKSNSSVLPGGTTTPAPNLVLRVDKAFDNGAALSIRAVQHKDIDTATSFSATGTVFAVSGQYHLTDTITGFGQVQQGDADGGNIFNGGSNGPVVNTTTGQLLLDRDQSWNIGLNQLWNEKWRASFTYGQVSSMNDINSAFVAASGGPVGLNYKVSQWHLNGIYTPVKGLDLGAEYIYGTRQTYDGQYGDLRRIDLMAKFSFF